MLQKRTTGCTAFNHIEFLFSYKSPPVLDAWVESLAAQIEESVKLGSKYKPGDSFQIGWNATKIDLDGEFLILREPEFAERGAGWRDANRWSAEVTQALTDFWTQRYVAESVGLEPVYSNSTEMATICSQFSKWKGFFLHRYDDTFKQSEIDSGWFIGCTHQHHDHSDPGKMDRQTLHQCALDQPGIVPYLALPPGTRVGNNKHRTRDFCIDFNGKEVEIRTASYLHEVLSAEPICIQQPKECVWFDAVDRYVPPARKLHPRARVGSTDPGYCSLTVAQIREQLKPWLALNQRLAWRPIVEDGEDAVTGSKFAGTPWIDENAPWPACNTCNQQMPLFLQLDLGTLPVPAQDSFGTGLLQLFYCSRCKDGGWEPFSNDIYCVRTVEPAVSMPQVTARKSQMEVFPARKITGWEQFIDLPSTHEHEQLGLEYEYQGDRTTLSCQSHGLRFERVKDQDLAENIADSQSGDKLAGWPRWIQGTEYPSCPECKRCMILLFQLDSEDHLPFMFGDCGCAYITQCPEHKEVVAFGWSCS